MEESGRAASSRASSHLRLDRDAARGAARARRQRPAQRVARDRRARARDAELREVGDALAAEPEKADAPATGERTALGPEETPR